MVVVVCEMHTMNPGEVARLQTGNRTNALTARMRVTAQEVVVDSYPGCCLPIEDPVQAKVLQHAVPSQEATMQL